MKRKVTATEGDSREGAEKRKRLIANSNGAPDVRRRDDGLLLQAREARSRGEEENRLLFPQVLDLPNFLLGTASTSSLLLHQHGTFTPHTRAHLLSFLKSLEVVEQDPQLFSLPPDRWRISSEVGRTEREEFSIRAEAAVTRAGFQIEVCEIGQQGTIRLLGAFCLDLPFPETSNSQTCAQPEHIQQRAMPAKTTSSVPKKLPRTMFPPPTERASRQRAGLASQQARNKQKNKERGRQELQQRWIDISILRREVNILIKWNHAVWKCEDGMAVEIGVVELCPQVL